MSSPPYSRPLSPSYYRRDKNHDYTSRCIYMLTLFKSDDMPWFSHISGGIGDYTGNLRVRVNLSPLGIQANNELKNLPTRFPWIEIWRSVVMPDHIHFIVFVKEAGHCHLGRIEETLCGNISRAWHKFQGKGADSPLQPVFKPYYHDRILRRRGQLKGLTNYVVNNPLRNYKRKLVPAPFKIKGEVEINGNLYTFYGNPEILENPLIYAVRLSRSWSYEQIKEKCEFLIKEAGRGCALAGPFIRLQEKRIMEDGIRNGGYIVKMLDNAITERFSLKPPFDDLFQEGRALLIGPAEYRTRNLQTSDERETFFHSLNDLAAALEEGASIRIVRIIP